MHPYKRFGVTFIPQQNFHPFEKRFCIIAWVPFVVCWHYDYNKLVCNKLLRYEVIKVDYFRAFNTYVMSFFIELISKLLSSSGLAAEVKYKLRKVSRDNQCVHYFLSFFILLLLQSKLLFFAYFSLAFFIWILRSFWSWLPVIGDKEYNNNANCN